MIGKISGKIEELEGNLAYINPGAGISYLVYLTPNLLTKLGEQVELYTYHVIKEDSQTLYGFEDKKQFDIYKKLISIDGVGPKTAFTIICFSNPDEIYTAVAANDVSYFNQIKGIGQKTAQRILLELSHLFKKSIDMGSLELSSDDQTVVEALKSLGFESRNISLILRQIDKKETVENKVKQAIRLMTSK